MTAPSLTATMYTLSIPASSSLPSISAFLRPGIWHVEISGHDHGGSERQTVKRKPRRRRRACGLGKGGGESGGEGGREGGGGLEEGGGVRTWHVDQVGVKAPGSVTQSVF